MAFSRLAEVLLCKLVHVIVCDWKALQNLSEHFNKRLHFDSFIMTRIFFRMS